MFEVFNINNNESAKYLYRGIESALYDAFDFGKRRCKLYYCTAEILEYKGTLVLVSYATPIAVYTRDGILYDCLRAIYGYTSTSSKHIYKFKKWLAENNYTVQHYVRFTN